MRVIDVRRVTSLVVDRYVAHDADDLGLAAAGRDSLADRAHSRKETQRERLADHRPVGRARVVLRVEQASFEKWNIHDAEVVARYHALLRPGATALRARERPAQRSPPLYVIVTGGGQPRDASRNIRHYSVESPTQVCAECVIRTS